MFISFHGFFYCHFFYICFRNSQFTEYALGGCKWAKLLRGFEMYSVQYCPQWLICWTWIFLKCNIKLFHIIRQNINIVGSGSNTKKGGECQFQSLNFMKEQLSFERSMSRVKANHLVLLPIFIYLLE